MKAKDRNSMFYYRTPSKKWRTKRHINQLWDEFKISGTTSEIFKDSQIVIILLNNSFESLSLSLSFPFYFDWVLASIYFIKTEISVRLLWFEFCNKFIYIRVWFSNLEVMRNTRPIIRLPGVRRLSCSTTWRIDILALRSCGRSTLWQLD
jgi:hypothetical protein